MNRRVLRLTAVAVAAALLPAAGAASAAEAPRLTEAQGSGFPDRTFVLSLPKPQVLDAGSVRITENGKAIPDATIVQAGSQNRSFGVVLAIDTSESMHDEAIVGAMDAARTFASRRPEKQALGVLFFNRGQTPALTPTTDGDAIEETLAATPELSKGTRLNDAAASAISMLDRAKVQAGSIVVLSDGADVGSNLTAAQVGDAARKAHVRVFTVGLRSPSYNSTSMRELASATGGEYAEASSAARLASVFEDLAQRLAGEYLITYTSLSKLGSDVKVAAQIEGVPGVARASYTAPQTPTAVITPEAPETGWWSSTAAFVTAGVVAALLLALALFLLVRPRRLTVEDRIEAFVSPMQKAGELQLTERQEASMLASAEKSLGRTRWWQAFVLDLDVAGFSVKPLVVVLAALVWAVAVAWVAALVTGQFFLPLILFFVVCYGVRRYVAFKAGRRRRLFADQLVDNLQVIVSAMRAGYSFVGALAVAVDDASEPARSELRRIVRDEQLGVPIEESVYEVARRMDNQEFEHVGLVAALQRDSGGNTAEVLDRLIESVRGRTEIRQLVRTLTAQGRMGGVIVSALPPTVAVILTLADPTYLDPLTDTFGGTMALFGAGCAMVAGWLFIRKIVDIKV